MNKIDDFDKVLYYNREILDDGNQLKDTLEDGIRIGTERGYKQGVEKGIEQGAELNANKIAKSMLKENYEISEIVKITGLSLEKVKRLK